MNNKICITSTVPEIYNSNSAIRSFVATGFRTILPDFKVSSIGFDSAVSHVLRETPSLVVAVGGLAMDAFSMDELQIAIKRTGGCLAVWLHDDPYEFDYSFKCLNVGDYVFTNEEWCVTHYRRSNVFHLPLAACPSTHYRDLQPVGNRDIDIFFCGVAYPNRVSFFRSIRDEVVGFRTAVRGSHWPADLLFAENKRMSVTEMANYANNSTITINIGRQHNVANAFDDLPATSPGPRTFETALSGCAQIYVGDTDTVDLYFNPQNEIKIVGSHLEFLDALKFLQAHPTEAYNMAKSSQDRALRCHTYANRAKKMIECMGW